MLKYNKSLYRIVKDVNDSIPTDFGGGSPLPKCYIMACLAQMLNLKHYVEIGIYRGKSLFSVAIPFILAGGTAVGIDPYLQESAFEYDLDESMKNTVNNYVKQTDFDAIFNEVKDRKFALGFGDSLQIIRDLSSNAAESLRNSGYSIDMLHIDGNHDTKFVTEDYELYYPLLSDDAIIVFDDVDWPSVDVVYQKAKSENSLIYEGSYNGVITYGILLKGSKTPEQESKARKLGLQLSSTSRKLENQDNKPVVSVGVLTYNHANYIAECLEHIFDQRGHFTMKVRICEDCSKDNTVEIIESALSRIDPCAVINVELIQNPQNIGAVQNFKQLVNVLGDGEYFTFCEGDDYWRSKDRVKAHIAFLEENPDLAFSFNSAKILYQETGEMSSSAIHEKLSDGPFCTKDLIAVDPFNFIGNLGLGFYRTKYLKCLNPELFECNLGDWMFNIAYSQFGKFGFIRKELNAYRKHSGGVWALTDVMKRNLILLRCIDDYSRLTNYCFDEDFQKIRESLIQTIQERDFFFPENSPDVIIFDDLFPHPAGGFRDQEYTCLLEAFDNSQIISILSESDLWGGCNKTFAPEYKLSHPHISHKLRLIAPRQSALESLGKVNTKLVYTIFLNNIYTAIDHIEHMHTPFVFTLYPGGGFSINDASSDKKLARVLTSDYFRGVIVTQPNIYDYLIKNNLCKKEHIHYIYGSVMSLDNVNRKVDKYFLADGKSTIDLCFVAHKYSRHGQDKGYDIFIGVAKALCNIYDNMHFHVVGGFDEDVIDVTALAGRVTFHGTKHQRWLRAFFENIDIIISPTLPYILSDGSFDGFPTGSCVEAALSKVAVFSTDELCLNQGYFKDGEEIVIINPDIDYIIGCIDFYVKQPELLKTLSEAGYHRAKALFNYDAQIAPRIKILQKILEPQQHTPTIIERQQRQIIPIMHCFDNNYVIPAAVSFYSMLQHASPAHEYKLYVLHSDVTWQNQQKLTALVENFSNATLEFIDMSQRFNDIWQNSPLRDTHYAKEVLYKLVAPSIFPQYDKLIITDVDVVFEGDISTSFFSFSPSDDVYLAGVKGIYPEGSFLENYYSNYLNYFGKDAIQEMKICGGYLVLNLHRLRTDKIEKVFLDYLTKHGAHLLQAEQDVLNFCLKEKNIVYLPLNYVVCTYAYELFPTTESYNTDQNYKPEEIENALQNPIQIHYAGVEKPWNSPNATKCGNWFSVLRQTDFYADYVRINQGNAIHPLQPSDVWVDYLEPEYPVMVSILCCTYNHSRFIRNTLDYLVNQKTSYSFEIIVSDDASTDDTQKIINEYKVRYPHLFKKSILRKRNVGIGQNCYEALTVAEGKYLTICDGDDYWINPEKLQLQVELMERNPNFSICCSSHKVHYVDSKRSDETSYINSYIKSTWEIKDSYDFNDLLYCRFIASCTVMIRWRLHGRVPDFLRQHFVIDFALTLIHSAFGRIAVTNEHILAQYNSSDKGIFLTKLQFMGTETQKIIREVNQFTNYHFNKSVNDYLKFVTVKPILQLGKMRKLKWFYTYWVPPFIQKMYIRAKVKRQTAAQNPRSSKIKDHIWSVYNELTPEAIKYFYRNKLKPILRKK